MEELSSLKRKRTFLQKEIEELSKRLKEAKILLESLNIVICAMDIPKEKPKSKYNFERGELTKKILAKPEKFTFKDLASELIEEKKIEDKTIQDKMKNSLYTTLQKLLSQGSIKKDGIYFSRCSVHNDLK